MQQNGTVSESVRTISIGVVGGGIVGMAFALAVARRGMAVTLFGHGLQASRAVRSERFEQRVYALSPATRAFLRDLEIWRELDPAFVGVVHDMRVAAHQVGHSALHLSAYQAKQEALAWIVGHDALSAALTAAIRLRSEIDLVDAKVSGVSFRQDGASIFSGTTRYEADLVVGADGINSLVREAAGIKSQRHEMGATGIVANFECSLGHNNCAYQWFSDKGVIAMLPLPGNAISLVWSAPNVLADELKGLTGEELAMRLVPYCNLVLGSLTPISASSAFPLSRLSVRHSVAAGVALIGDAAHVIHPLAGQGLNLGLDDAHTLADVIEAKEFYRKPGEQKLLRRYERRRAEAVSSMGAATDGLFWLFGGRAPGLDGLAGATMSVVDRIAPIKSRMMRAATHNGVPPFFSKDVL